MPIPRIVTNQLGILDALQSGGHPGPRLARTMAMITLFVCGDVMLARGIDQILPQPCDPRLYEPSLEDARDYIAIAEDASGPIPRGVPPEYPWGEALAVRDASSTSRPPSPAAATPRRRRASTIA
jgi:hypothetical protein